MHQDKKTAVIIDAYIRSFPTDVQRILEKLRQIVRENAPEADEAFAYQMPSYKLKGKPLVYFAAWKSHIGLYATPSGNEAFKKELAPFASAKGSVKFPLDQPIPYDLITKIVKFRVKEILEKNG